MTDNVESKIWMALKAHVETCLPDVQKAWPAVVFKPDYKEPFIRVGKVQVAPQRMQLASGKPHQRTGTLILTMVAPITYLSNKDSLMYWQDQIARHFIDGTKMTYQDVCVSVTRYPHCVDGYLDAGWWNAPVSISWRCFA